MRMSTTTSTNRERAPLLLMFGSLADRMANILRSRPSLTARIAFAPPETIHAIAALLHLAPEAAGSDTEVGDFIEQRDSRELLKKALPDCPRGYTARWIEQVALHCRIGRGLRCSGAGWRPTKSEW